MSRTADHDARRRQITDAFRQVALRDGARRVTIAGTARAAGVSVGLVQHYYADKDALVADAMHAIRADVEGRVEAATALAEARHERIEDMVFAGLCELLPLDERRRAEAYLRHSFAGLALEDQRLARRLRESEASLTARAVGAIENGVACGEVTDATTAPLVGHELVVLAEGLSARLLGEPAAEARDLALATLRRRLGEVFPGFCRRYEADGDPAPAT